VGKQVVNRLVATHLKAPLPGAFNGLVRRCDHEKHVNEVTESSEKIAARLFGIARKAVEPE